MEETETKKPVKAIVITAILFLVTAALGGYGLYLDKFANKEYDINYSYYVNKKHVKNMPEKEDGYEFKKYKCNHGITGKWSETKWKFVPKAEEDGSCNLYFVDREYKVELIAPDGVTIAGQSELKVKKEEPAEFEVALSESVSIKEITCTNDQEAVYANDKVTLESLTDDTTCTIVTEDAKYNVEAKAINGKVTGYQQEVVYGENVIYTVSPTNGYSLDNVVCTNDQTGTWSNGKLTVSKVTNNTVCTVSFKASQYTVTVKATNGSPATQTKTIASKGTISFTVTPTTGTNATKISCTNGQSGKYSNNSFVVTNVTANTTCTVTFPK